MRAQSEAFDKSGAGGGGGGRFGSSGGKKRALYRFNGVFLACFQTSHIWGNLASSLVLWGAGGGSGGEEKSGDDGGGSGLDKCSRWPLSEGAKCGIYLEDPWVPAVWNITFAGKYHQ